MEERRVTITAGGVEVTALLNDGRTADLVWSALPIEASASTWGDEIRPASPVNVLGKLQGDATVLKRVSAGEPVTVEKG